jgi:transposase
VETLRVHKQQVSAFMLKHGRHYPRKRAWSMRYLRWLQEQQFEYPAHQIVLQEMVEAVRIAKERVERLERTIEEFLPAWSLAPIVGALRALRGVDLIVAATFVSEVGDIGRFDNPRQLMGYLGLVPSERSTGDTVRRGGITIDGFATCWSRAPGPTDIRQSSANRSSISCKTCRRRSARSPGRRRRG